MKTQKTILIAFVLNLFFSIMEFIGGYFTQSVAITSDALHDFVDAITIGIAYCLERISHRPANKENTYGFIRYGVVGSELTTLLLILGSAVIMYHATEKLLHPAEIHHTGMIWMAVFGVVVNGSAAYLTRDHDSLTQKSVNLHMLEDVLGWLVLLVGAWIIKFSGWNILDPILSLVVSLFILYEACKHLKDILNILLDKTPADIHPDEIKAAILMVPEVDDVHHLHIRSLDGKIHCATVHIITDTPAVKAQVRSILESMHIQHATIEVDPPGTQLSSHEPQYHIHSHHHH